MIIKGFIQNFPVLPSQPFFLDEIGNKVESKIGPYHEGDTLVLSCFVIGGKLYFSL